MAHGPVVAIVPIGALEGAKSRLGAMLDAEERQDLATRLARRTIEAALATPGIAEVLVVTPDDEVRELAMELGARPLLQRGDGLNGGLAQARAEAVAAGAGAVLIVPMDLPRVSPSALAEVLATLDGPRAGGLDDNSVTDPAPGDDARPLVTIVPDRHGRGTNALLVAPPDAIDFCFGGDSRAAHVAAARAVGARVVELGGPLTLDLDTPDDLLLVDLDHPEAVRG